MQHLMLDIETLGTRVGSVVLSAALVRFSDEAHTSVNMDTKAQYDAGLTHDESTVAWWQQQSQAAKDAAFGAVGVPLVPALQHLSAWIAWAAPSGDFLIWCHGATFDCPLLEEVYRRAGVPCPWRFWQVRDTRTLYDLSGVDLRSYAVPPPHVVLNDALAQTRAANAALRIIADRRGVAA